MECGPVRGWCANKEVARDHDLNMRFIYFFSWRYLSMVLLSETSKGSGPES